MKILIFGSKGLVGTALQKKLKEESGNLNIFPATRKDANLFSYKETKKLINDFEPDLIINAAAKVGGILSNNQKRMEFILENLKINMNIFFLLQYWHSPLK